MVNGLAVPSADLGVLSRDSPAAGIGPGGTPESTVISKPVPVSFIVCFTGPAGGGRAPAPRHPSSRFVRLLSSYPSNYPGAKMG